MIVLPGPALVMIPAGLAILAVEFTWARHWLRIVRDKAQKALSDSKASRSQLAAGNELKQPKERNIDPVGPVV